MMTKADVARLLTLITAFDRRTLGEADVEAWHLVLAEYDVDDCAQAVKDHFTASRGWLMPVDVAERATVIVRARAGRAQILKLALAEQLADAEDQLAIAAAPPLDRAALGLRLKALATSRRNAVPREDPRPPNVRLAEARREVAELANRTPVEANIPNRNQEG